MLLALDYAPCPRLSRLYPFSTSPAPEPAPLTAVANVRCPGTELYVAVCVAICVAICVAGLTNTGDTCSTWRSQPDTRCYVSPRVICRLSTRRN
jgi:hypothetical protein